MGNLMCASSFFFPIAFVFIFFPPPLSSVIYSVIVTEMTAMVNRVYIQYSLIHSLIQISNKKSFKKKEKSTFIKSQIVNAKELALFFQLLSNANTEVKAESDGEVKRYTSYLHLVNIRDSMAGRYQCFVSNDFGSSFSQRAYVNVFGKQAMLAGGEVMWLLYYYVGFRHVGLSTYTNSLGMTWRWALKLIGKIYDTHLGISKIVGLCVTFKNTMTIWKKINVEKNVREGTDTSAQFDNSYSVIMLLVDFFYLSIN